MANAALTPGGTDTQERGAPPSFATPALPARGLTPRALLLALLFMGIATLWVRQAELVAEVNNLSETLPCMPAIAALLFLALAQALGRRLPWVRDLSRAEKVVLYGFLSVGVIPLSLCWIRWFLPFQIIPFYFATPANKIGFFQKYLPAWLAPHNRELIRQYYEGSPDGRVPWGAWLVPMAAWFVFLMLLWGTLLCLLTLVRRQWTEHERLSYPLLYLPLNIIGGVPTPAGERSFFRQPLMWLGFTLACVHNLLNVLAAYYPSVPALGQQFDPKPFFPNPPWNQAQSLLLVHRLELVGLGYLIPTEILFTAWFTHLAGQFLRVFLYARGYELREFPYTTTQCSGAYVALVLFTLWSARAHLRRVFRKAIFGDRRVRDDDEPISYRAATFGFLVGSAGILLWASLAGMRLAPAAAFFGVIFLFAIGYARLRAESGAPILRAFPHFEAMTLPAGLVGSEALRVWAGMPTLAVWSSLYALGAQTFVPAAAYHHELLKLGDHARIRRPQMALVSVLALAVGILFAYWMLLSTAYHRGAINVELTWCGPGGTARRYAMDQYRPVAGWLESAVPPDHGRQLAVVAGFVVAAAVSIARFRGWWMPFHPTGYVIGLAMGSACWSSFLFVWVLKVLIVRLGGPVLYRRLIPGFIGVAFGEFFSGGLVWGLVSAFFPEVGRAYNLWYL